MQHNRATSKAVGDHVLYIYKKWPAFGFPGVQVDGMDVLKVQFLYRLDDAIAVLVCCHKVREVAMEAIERARNGGGPTLIECETYRFRGHSLADPDELRSKEEKEMCMSRFLCSVSYGS